MKTNLLKNILMLGLFVGCGGSAWGYDVSRTETGKLIRWHTPVVTYHISQQIRESVSEKGAENAILESFKTWQRALGSRLTLKFGGFVDLKTSSNGAKATQTPQRQNTIRWEHKNWPYESTTLAVTLVTYSQKTGEILDADLVYNGVYVKWSTKKTAALPQQPTQSNARPTFDLENVTTHEIGHFLGLQHSDELEATMYSSTHATELKKRDLHEDDIEGIEFLYTDVPTKDKPTASQYGGPSSPAPGTGPLPFGGFACSTSGEQTPSFPLSLLGLLVLCVFFRRPTSRDVEHKNASFRAPLHFFGLLLLACLLCPSAADASIVKSLTLKELSSRSSRVVSGKIVAQTSFWRAKHIMTLSTIQPEECFKVACPASKQLQVLQFGGTVGDIGMKISGVQLLKPQDRVLVFLKEIPSQSLTGSPLSVPKALIQPGTSLAPSVLKSKRLTLLYQIVGFSQGLFRFLPANKKQKHTMLQSDRHGLQLAERSKDGRWMMRHGTQLRVPASLMLLQLKKMMKNRKIH